MAWSVQTSARNHLTRINDKHDHERRQQNGQLHETAEYSSEEDGRQRDSGYHQSMPPLWNVHRATK